MQKFMTERKNSYNSIKFADLCPHLLYAVFSEVTGRHWFEPLRGLNLDPVEFFSLNVETVYTMHYTST